LVVATMLAEAANKASLSLAATTDCRGMEVWPILAGCASTCWQYALFLLLTVLFLCWLAARRIVHSPFGRSLTGLRENVRRMHAIGAPVIHRRLVIYTNRSRLGRISGALIGQTTQFVSPVSQPSNAPALC